MGWLLNGRLESWQNFTVRGLDGKHIMHILLLQMELYLPGVHSLKEKRSIIKPLLNNIRRDYNVSAAEVDLHDQWQHAVLAVVAVGNMRPALEKIERDLTDLVENHGDIQLSQSNLQWL